MWGLMSLIGFGPQLHATQEFLTELYCFLPNGILGWAFGVGFVVVAICAYYLTWKGPPISTVTIKRYDDLFPIVVASLRKFRQPRSVLITADTISKEDSGWDSECGDSDDESTTVKTEPNFGTNLYWYNSKPMWVERGFLAGSGSGKDPPQEFLSFTIWSWSCKTMTEIVSQWFQEQRGNEVAYTVVREADSQSFNPWSIRTLKLSRPLESIILPKETKDDIIQDLKNFKRPATRRWYTKRGYPYRRGHLYYGKPGTGKSSLASALAAYLHLELYIVPINDPKIDQETLAKMFRRLRDPCIVLLEDIDALNATTTERGSSKASQSGLTNLSALLNVLDGVAAQEGMILIMTSNHLEALDEALVRPGRIDKKVHFTNASQSGLNDLFLVTYLSDANEEIHNTPAIDSEKIPTPVINNEEIHNLAERFSTLLPSNEFTVAEVQGYLFHHKEDPHGALAGAAAWSEQKAKERLSLAAEGSLEDQETDLESDESVQPVSTG